MLPHLQELNNVIWGTESVDSEIFSRWSQGFKFSEHDSTALEQYHGGPCAIIAAVQAYILKNILFVKEEHLESVIKEDSQSILRQSLVDILEKVSCNSKSKKLIYCWFPTLDPAISSPHEFIAKLDFLSTDSSEELNALIFSLSIDFELEFSVLTFLYSVLLTCESLDELKDLVEENGCLIDPRFGHASQCLLNLLISGCITPNLFNGDKNLGGLTIKGITSQPDIGFLTLIEASHHCEVGWFLKNPSYPIWVLGSESHFTVLASPEKSLVSKEDSLDTSCQKASLRVAERFFTELSEGGDESGFITVDKLDLLVSKLNLKVEDIEALKLILDAESLGIILRHPFLNYFYPNEMAERRSTITTFKLVHYNSLIRSNPENQVKAQFGDARLIDPEEELADPSLSTTPAERTDLQRCLQTKWPTIRIKWNTAENAQKFPSIN